MFVTGLHEEALEDDLMEFFADVADPTEIHFLLDRQTGFAKGHAIVEMANKGDAEKAVQDLNGEKLMGQAVQVNWAFLEGSR